MKKKSYILKNFKNSWIGKGNFKNCTLNPNFYLLFKADIYLLILHTYSDYFIYTKLRLQPTLHCKVTQFGLCRIIYISVGVRRNWFNQK